MTLPFKLHAFEATADLLGDTFPVQYQSGGPTDPAGVLAIQNVSFVQAMLILEVLSGPHPGAASKLLAGADAASAPAPLAAAPAPLAAAQPVIQQAGGRSGRARTKAADVVAEAPKETAPAPEPAATKAEATATPEEATAIPDAAPEAPKDPWGIAPPGQDPDAAPAAGVAKLSPEQMEKLQAADKLRLILMILVEEVGITSFAQLVATCEWLKTQNNPILARIEGLHERLTRATETLQMKLTA